MNRIVKALMERDEIVYQEALDTLRDAQLRIYEGEDPEEMLEDLGLEPDYLEDLI